MAQPQQKKQRSKRKGRGAAPPAYARSVIHYITKKRIFPKTAKAFPLWTWRKKKLAQAQTAPPEQLPLPFPDGTVNEAPKSAASSAEPPTAEAQEQTPPTPKAPPRRRRASPTPRR